MIADLIDHVDTFAHRIIQDALQEGASIYWRRRAAAFRWAAPRPGDFTGRATEAELAALADRCRRREGACLHAAEVALIGGGDVLNIARDPQRSRVQIPPPLQERPSDQQEC